MIDKKLLAILIFFIAIFLVSCRDKPTGLNDFSELNDTLAIDAGQSFTQFVGRTIRSKESISSGIAAYFWAEFTEDGIKYGSGGETSKPDSYNSTVGLSKTVFGSSYTAYFTGSGSAGSQQGYIRFEVDGDFFKKIEVKFTSGTSYDGQTFDCQFVNE